MPAFPDYMAALFEPVIAAANRPDLTGRLFTSALPEARRETQYKKLSLLSRSGDGPIYLGPSGFIARFTDGFSTRFCVSTEQLNNQEADELEDWASSEGLVRTDLDESTFLFLTFTYRALYRVKSAYLQQPVAENMIDVQQPSGKYEFDISDVIDWYERVAIFEARADSLFLAATDFAIAAHLTAGNKAYRSPLITDDVALALYSLLSLGNVNPELVFFALTSSHWKHVFLEVYRCIEALFFLPWALKIKIITGYTNSAEDLARSVHEQFPYRPQERESIRGLFGLADVATVKASDLMSVRCFRELMCNSDASSEAFGDLIYRLRNQLVHLRDYSHSDSLDVTLACWPPLVRYLCTIVSDLYTKYRQEIGFEFALPTTV